MCYNQQSYAESDPSQIPAANHWPSAARRWLAPLASQLCRRQQSQTAEGSWEDDLDDLSEWQGGATCKECETNIMFLRSPQHGFQGWSPMIDVEFHKVGGTFSQFKFIVVGGRHVWCSRLLGHKQASQNQENYASKPSKHMQIVRGLLSWPVVGQAISGQCELQTTRSSCILDDVLNLHRLEVARHPLRSQETQTLGRDRQCYSHRKIPEEYGSWSKPWDPSEHNVSLEKRPKT